MVASREGRDGCVQLLLDRGAQGEHQNKVSAFWDQPWISLLPPHPPPAHHLLTSVSTLRLVPITHLTSLSLLPSLSSPPSHFLHLKPPFSLSLLSSLFWPSSQSTCLLPILSFPGCILGSARDIFPPHPPLSDSQASPSLFPISSPPSPLPLFLSFSPPPLAFLVPLCEEGIM